MTQTYDQQSDSIFALEAFFPYQVRLFYLQVSQAVSDIYSSRYGLTVSEWRTMAVLGNHQPLSASDVVQRSSIDKVQVSRAIQGLLKRELLERQVDSVDRRKVNLQLTAAGQQVFADLVPRILDLEQQLLAGLSEDERRTLKALMAKVQRQAEAINSNEDNGNADITDNQTSTPIGASKRAMR